MVNEKMLEYLIINDLLTTYYFNIKNNYDIDKLLERRDILAKEFLENYAKHN